VCKPRDGAGSQATFLVSNAEDLEAALVLAVAEGWHGVMILQPFVRGQAVSVAFLLGPQQCLPLLPASQHLSEDGRFRYRGGRLPLATDLAKRAVSLGRRAVAAVTGLKGYVGVDLVVGSEMDGSGDRVIEINPRLTTSYVGLRALARGNLAEAMLQLALGKTVSPPEWNPGEIVFDSCGNSNLHWAGCSEFDERKDSVNAENIATGNRRRTRNPGPRAPGHGPVGR
jgi:predicted ATP-grasp superfamily ATP-dependent carboligase